MTPEPLLVPDYLVHILQPIQRIRIYTEGISEQDFYSDLLIQDVVICNIEVMGEAARNAQLCCKDIDEVRNGTQSGRYIVCATNWRMDTFRSNSQLFGIV